MDIIELKDFANFLADEVAKISLTSFMSIQSSDKINIKNKSSEGYDPVTEADLLVEKKIRSLINDRYPNHEIIGEEITGHVDPSKPCWVIDPIDGTRAYISGVPVWGTMIAFNEGGSTVLGLIDHPALDQRYLGYEGKSFKASSKSDYSEIKTRNKKKLIEAVASSTTPRLFDDHSLDVFKIVMNKSLFVRWGLDCLGFSLLASGLIDLVLEAGLKSYDVQAAIPIIEGAGGKISSWDGGDPREGGNILASGSQELHEEVLKLINS